MPPPSWITQRHNWLPGFFPHAQGGFNVLCIPPHWSVPAPHYHCSFQTNVTLYMGKIFQFLSYDVALDHFVSQHVSIFTTQSTVFLPYSTAPNPLYFYHVLQHPIHYIFTMYLQHVSLKTLFFFFSDCNMVHDKHYTNIYIAGVRKKILRSMTGYSWGTIFFGHPVNNLNAFYRKLSCRLQLKLT